MRKKASDAVQRDALAIAKRKLNEGCGDCAQAYAQLAADDGANEEELAGLGLEVSRSRLPRLTRRRFLATAAGAAVAATGAVTLQAQPAAALIFFCIPLEAVCLGVWLVIYICCDAIECIYLVDNTGIPC